jgi:hypothetical protein
LQKFCKCSVGTLNQLASLCNQIRVWDCVCMFILNIYQIKLVNNNSTKYERVCFSYKGKFLMHVNYNYLYTVSLLGVIRHHPRAITLGRSLFLRESIGKNPIHIYYPCWIIHFNGCFSAKYLPPPLSQLIPPHININAVLLLMKMYPDFSEIPRIKMCFCIARVFDDHRSCQKLMKYITNIKTMLKRYYWIQKLPVLQRLFIQIRRKSRIPVFIKIYK